MDQLDKLYYKIKDVSDILGIPATTLRYWEREFPECSPRRSSTNIRYYTPQDIETFRKIHYLVKIKGLKLSVAKEQLHQNNSNVSRRVEVIERLREVRADLEKLLESLEKRRD